MKTVEHINSRDLSRSTSMTSDPSHQFSIATNIEMAEERADRTVSICGACAKIDIRKFAALKLLELQQEEAGRGILISSLGNRISTATAPECALCSLFHHARGDDSGDTKCPYELRAYSYFKCNQNVSYWDMTPQFHRNDLACMAVVPAISATRDSSPSRSSSGASLIFVSDLSQRRDSHGLFTPTVMDQEVNYDFMRACLQFCLDTHLRCRYVGNLAKRIKLVDCYNSQVVTAPKHTNYIALSYVWGQSLAARMFNSQIPQTIRDAMTVTRRLGYQYLWVDQYCIDQNDAQAKHEQIQQMDLIYLYAEVTLIAAAGESADYGLPGVSKKRACLPTALIGSTVLFPVPCSTRMAITNSKWNARGWTFQEGILSRRRLVFTDNEVYFECSTHNFFESMPMKISMLRTQELNEIGRCLHSGVVSQERDSSFGAGLRFAHSPERNRLLERYSRRTLSHPEDRLNAFIGILRQYERARNTHIWGLTYGINPLGRNAAIFVRSLLWASGSRFHENWGMPQNIGRIWSETYKAPSWTWAGWSGEIHWAQDLRGIAGWSRVGSIGFQILDAVDPSPVVPIGQLQNDARFHQLVSMSHDVVLHLDGEVLSPESIMLHGISPNFKITLQGRGPACWALSKRPESALIVYELLKATKWELFMLSTVWNTYPREGRHFWLVVEQKGEDYTRVGLCASSFDEFSQPPTQEKTICLR